MTFIIILLVVLCCGIVVFTMYIKRHPYDEIPVKRKPDDCNDEDCVTCTTMCASSKILSSQMSAPKYFDDEELDAFAKIAPDKYDENQIKQFREVLESLEAKEVSDWLESLRKREIELPDSLRDEAMMLVNG